MSRMRYADYAEWSRGAAPCLLPAVPGEATGVVGAGRVPDMRREDGAARGLAV